MTVAIPSDYCQNCTAGYHNNIPQGSAAQIKYSISLLNSASYTVQVDFYITQDGNNAACIAAGSLACVPNSIPEHFEFTALTTNLSAGNHQWDLWLYARDAPAGFNADGSTGYITHLESWIMPTIYKA